MSSIQLFNNSMSCYDTHFRLGFDGEKNTRKSEISMVLCHQAFKNLHNSLIINIFLKNPRESLIFEWYCVTIEKLT
jgi:hypothetical protein